MRALLTILINLLFLTSCSNRLRIKSEDTRWIPYIGNERLVFSDNNGYIDTVFLSGYETNYVYVNEREILGDNVEQRHLKCYISPIDTTNKWSDSREAHYLISQTAEADSGSFIGLYFRAKNAIFHYYKIIRPVFFDTAQVISLKTRLRMYDGVIVLRFDTSVARPDDIKNGFNVVDKLYWSKANGVVRYDLKDKQIELIDKYGH